MAKKGKGGKGKGFFGTIGSFLGSIPAVGKVKNAAKSVKKKIKNTKKKLKKAIKKAKKKLKKKLKKKIGKVFTKARKLKNNLSKSKMVKKFKRAAKKVVLATKKVASKAKSTAKAVTKAVTQTAKKVATAVKSIDVKQAISTAVDFIPIVGNVKAAYEVVVGKDPFTGKKLAPWERAVSAAAIVGGPAVKGAKHAAKIGGSAVSGIAKAGKKGVPTKAPAAPPKATKPPAKPTETKKPSKSTPPVAAKPKATPAPTKATKPPAKPTETKKQSKSTPPVASKPSATQAPPKVTKPAAVKGPSKDTPSDKVKYYRVQGGSGDNASFKRMNVNDDGTISIATKNSNLSVSAETMEHAEYFHRKRGDDSYIIEMEVDVWFHDIVKEYAIKQKDYKTNPLNQGKTAPKIVDPSKPGFAMELPPIWHDWLEEYVTNAKIIK
ncbi:pre-toxin TG domain-containing protein [Lysinibacillus parviboronicapiens]|uniref:pre-toxin TG domain-containing protein n=1 Tax=Lysinibacillus parviboronicapiens TaxID=436516 RepID=UPI000D344101|nr:pre-toxin TG domain-containing protein [Lysinibacillus parviboronicapiens]